MRIVLALLLALVVAVPALAGDPEPYVRTCSTSQYGEQVRIGLVSDVLYRR